MKTKILMPILFGACILFFGCSENALTPALDEPAQAEQQEAFLKGAKKPEAKLVGATDVPFTFTPPTFWNGTVDFGDDGIFSLTFISYDPPRDFSQASPFYEDFIIYKLGTDWTLPENVVMKGWNKGVVTYANGLPDPVDFHANGKVMEAYGPLEAWDDCNVHIKGLVYFDASGAFPLKAVGELRIN